MGDSIAERQNDFGLIDVIEAFTAMRQEFRNRSNEDRELAQSLHESTTKVESFAQRVTGLLDSIESKTTASSEDDAARRLAECLAEVDHCVSYAIARVTQPSSAPREQIEQSIKAFEQNIRTQSETVIASQGWLARRFARPAANQICEMVDRELQRAKNQLDQALAGLASQDATIKGLAMLADRVRKLIETSGIAKVETVGKPFDGEIMHAIASVAAETIAESFPARDGSLSGTVIEQIAPAYLYKGRVLRFAEVKVAL
ncbi:nucleotide exchange factor GrpE [Stieleria sp. ICT_E10.1]|uniref:nucleotide exchange factor GrpE n=1 Tax=Stieleria sedimenti TaxID=2976331 RepID=UPI0021803259|nr:nucleotide exchange factor GrpE [Stieleria sedimenti]MCS7467423.1 nucleotide exchange factor GrpE [Stieleria sedimenti]